MPPRAGCERSTPRRYCPTRRSRAEGSCQMAAPVDLSKLTVIGPFWRADVTVASLAAPRVHFALRRLFLDRQPRRVGGTAEVLTPGTMLALCLPQRVVVRPGTASQASFEWRTTGSQPPALGTFDEVRTAVQ